MTIRAAPGELPVVQGSFTVHVVDATSDTASMTYTLTNKEQPPPKSARRSGSGGGSCAAVPPSWSGLFALLIVLASAVLGRRRQRA